MSWKSRLSAVAAAMALVLYACGPAGEPVLTITAQPYTINNQGQTSTVTVTASRGDTPGTGTVRFSSPVGSLSAPVELTLANGTAAVDFSCDATLDPLCKGLIRVNAEWTADGTAVPASLSITVSGAAPDAGNDGGAGGGGGDGGMPPIDGGMRLDGGTFDGGMRGEYRVDLVSVDKAVLLEGTQDVANFVFRVATNTQTPVPVADATVTLATNGGSLSASGTTLNTQLTTDSLGLVTLPLYVAGALRDTFIDLQAASFDARTTARIKVVKVETITWKSDSTTSMQLTVRSTGIGFSTPVFFVVKDPNGLPLAGVDVSLGLAPNPAAGCMVAPPIDRSDAMGVVRSTLTAGETQGIAVVQASVEGLTPAVSPNFQIVIGRPSDEKLAVTCSRPTLGALNTPTNPPRNDLTMTCTASFADRNSVRPPFAVGVSWLSEEGQVGSSSTGAPNSGSAVTTFSTAGNLPVPTTPFVGEPTNGSLNPRDMFLTIVVAMPGEEQFWDGSGANGVFNGTWDPGEYFVDLPEPFVDSNDNGTRDPGEDIIDTERIDCATGQKIAKNLRWDPPNGCWDANTQIWRSTHVVYSGALVSVPAPEFLEFSPPLPTLVAPLAVHTIEFNWYDSYFNRLSNDGVSLDVSKISGLRGTASVAARTGDGWGHTITYPTIRATEVDAGVFTDDGDCDPTNPNSGYPQTRCLRTVKFGPWKTSPSGGRLTITGASAQPALPDGGVAPPTTTSYELRGINSQQATRSIYPFAVQFQ